MRASGVMLPIFSLFGNEGIGTLGKSAYDFVDFLYASGQKFWQVVPVNHNDEGGSPYRCFSNLSGNIYLIDLKTLVEKDLLDEKDYRHFLKNIKNCSDTINYKQLYRYKFDVLVESYIKSYKKIKDKINRFRQDNDFWVENYALFMSLKMYVFENKCWNLWDASARDHNNVSIDIYKDQLKDKIDFFVFAQYLFFDQWMSLKKYANSKDIKFMGEVPLYSDLDSTDVWSNSKLFSLDENKNPLEKLHNNSIYEQYYCFDTKVTYNWAELKKQHFKFILKKIDMADRLYDMVILSNIEHYYNYNVICLDDKKNKISLNKKAFGIDFFKELSIRFPFINFACSNNVNDVNDNFYKLVFMQDGFLNYNLNKYYLPHEYNKNMIVYTSGFYLKPLKSFKFSLKMEEKRFCKKYIGKKCCEKFNNAFIRKAYASVADIVIVPIHDFFNLGKNHALCYNPNSQSNWNWRLDNKMINKKLINLLNRLVTIYDRK